jgi:hypothetical protein
MNGRKHFRQRQTARGRQMMLVMSMATLSGCAATGVSGPTEQTVCRELRADLPSFSSRDTPETLAGGARFMDVFEAVCPRPR